jgi:predicted transcriptional regulator
MNIDVTTSNIAFLEVFSSETRVRIIEMLNEKSMNIKDIASTLNLSSAIITKHIQKLEGAGIIKCENSAAKRGMQKICTLNMDRVLLQLRTKAKESSFYYHAIPVGQYSSFNVKPTCGLASATKLIGVVDDSRYFADPEHTMADILWFGSGWVEYRIPNYLLRNQKMKSIEISMEISSEAPGFNEDWPSDITFIINGLELGSWTSPGDFGKNKGVFTPEWWNIGTQYGQLKSLRVNETGSYIDGLKLSDINISDLGITFGVEITLKIANLETSRNVGGINIFGKNFGNYNQDIQVAIGY